MTLRMVILSTLRKWIGAAEESRDRVLVGTLREAVDRIDPPIDIETSGDRSSTGEDSRSDAASPTTFTVRLRGTRTSDMSITGISAAVRDGALLIYGASGNAVFAAPFEVIAYCVRTDAQLPDARRRSPPSPRATKRSDRVRPAEKGSTAPRTGAAVSDPRSTAQNDDATIAEAAGS